MSALAPSVAILIATWVVIWIFADRYL